MIEKDRIRPKWLTVAQLKRVLAELPDDYELICNQNTLNLTVHKPDADGKHAPLIGQIDFLGEGEFEQF